MHLHHPPSWWERLAGFFNHRRKLLRAYAHFRRLLRADHRCHQCMAALERVQGEDLPVDFHKVRRMAALLERQTERLVKELTAMAPRHGRAAALNRVRRHMAQAVRAASLSGDSPLAVSMDEAAGVAENLLGGKALQAARLKERGLSVPRFFVLTTKAFAHVLTHNGVEDEVARRLDRLDVSSPEQIRRTAHKLCRMLEDCALPQDLLRVMNQAHRRVFGGDADSVFLCVRSSAVGEDRAYSFAGQYLSVLNVPASALPDAYRCVIASKYTANAIAHRIFNGYLDEETPMAVLVMETVNAARSGVAYSTDPAMGDARRLFVHGVWGMGETLMRGEATPHVVSLDRTSLSILENSPRVPKQLEKPVVDPRGGLKRRPLTSEERRTGPVDGPLARLLAQQLMICEELLSGPVDLEWAVDFQGRMFILQARDMASHRLPKIMEVLGHLLGITRLLDMHLQTEDDVLEETARFFTAHPDVFSRSSTVE
uniref:Phosphoenolpyruvate synthase n=1 Tax=Desulfacinum infernum TaxID=35837 RepID=A0A832EI60_9BACT